MRIKSQVLTFIIFVATLFVILSSAWIAQQWPSRANAVTIGVLVFAALLLVVAAIGVRKST